MMKILILLSSAFFFLGLTTGCTYNFNPRTMASRPVYETTPAKNASIAILPSKEFQYGYGLHNISVGEIHHLKADLADAISGEIAYSLLNVFTDVVIIPPENQDVHTISQYKNRLYLNRAYWKATPGSSYVRYGVNIDVSYLKDTEPAPRDLNISCWSGQNAWEVDKFLLNVCLSGMPDSIYNAAVEDLRLAMQNTLSHVGREVVNKLLQDN